MKRGSSNRHSASAENLFPKISGREVSLVWERQRAKRQRLGLRPEMDVNCHRTEWNSEFQTDFVNRLLLPRSQPASLERRDAPLLEGWWRDESDRRLRRVPWPLPASGQSGSGK